MSSTYGKAPETPKIPDIEGKLIKLADKTTERAGEIMEKVGQIINNLPPEVAVPAAVALLACLIPKENPSDKKKDLKKLKEEVQEKKATSAIKTTPDQIQQKVAEKVEQLHSERHWRSEHPKNGTVHLWHPEYKGDQLDEVVVYLHGFHNSADMSWNGNKVGEQFRKSGRKALFIVPESQQPGKPIPWKDLDELITYAKSQSGVNVNKKVTIMGHSGAYATLADWLKYEYVKETILVDASYGSSDKFREWAKKEGKRLVIAVAKGETPTKKVAEQIVRNNEDAKLYNGVPKYSEETRVAKLIYFTTQFGHSEMARNSTDVIAGALGLAGASEKLPSRKGTEFAEAISGNRKLKYPPDPEFVKKLCDNFNARKESLMSANNFTRLKESVIKAIQYADNLAQQLGYRIKISSGYRSPERQKELYASAKPEDRGTLIGKPGGSEHQSGGGVDCYLTRLGSEESLTPLSAKNDKPSKYTEILERCMNRAGFVRYIAESWHYGIGSRQWADIMQKQGYIKPDERLASYTYKRDRLSA